MSRFLLPLLLLLPAIPAAHAAPEDELLPVEQAFALRTTVIDREHVQLDWKIAPDYYLYRDKIRVKTDAPGVGVRPLDLPPGEKKHDEFLGDVEVFHHAARAIVPLTIADPTLAQVVLKVSVQGCHEVDPKICYPPSPSTVTVDLPPAKAAAPTAAAASSLAAPAAPVASSTPVPGVVRGTTADVFAIGHDESSPIEALPLPPEEAFQSEVIAVSGNELLVRFTMAPNYYLYRDRTRIDAIDVADGSGALVLRDAKLDWPPGKPHVDEHFGNVIVYYDVVEVPVRFARMATDAQKLAVTLTLQGCEEDGICYQPMKRKLAVDLPAGTITPVAVAGDAGDAAALNEPDRLAAALAGPDRLLTLLLFFGFGLLLAFTPCVLPMIPILSGIIAGAGPNVSTRRAFVLSLTYVLASAVVFTIAGIVAGLAGANLQAAFQKPWLLTLFALLFVALAMSMFGFYELQLPAALQTKLANSSNRQAGGSLKGVAIMGALSALIVGPCVAPPLAAAIIVIAEKRDPLLGGAALFLLALGMGAPLILIGTGAGRFVPRAGAWMEAVKQVFGVVFLLLAVWMFERFLDVRWIMAMLAAIFIGSGVALGALARTVPGAPMRQRLAQAFGILLLLVGAAQLVGALSGARDWLQPLAGLRGGAAQHAELPFKRVKSGDDLDRELAAAKAAGKPVVFDWYADWCVACKEMEKYTLPKPEVQAQLARFVMLQADVTANDDVDQALTRRFGIYGPPYTMLYDCSGEEQRALRLAGYEEAAAFVARLAKVPDCAP
ncbi:MAG TPA: protein-disulfide reductase DsbD [Xanthomonadales bacterium]|nr:protein-disulfide reductase DsbD [Xanthomonadales bacterium]